MSGWIILLSWTLAHHRGGFSAPSSTRCSLLIALPLTHKIWWWYHHLIYDSDEKACREEVRHLTHWYYPNNLDLNTRKWTSETHWSLCPLPHKEEIERLASFKFLYVCISADLTGTTDISHQVGKAQQRFYFLGKLKHAHLTYCCTVWFVSCIEENRKALRQVVRVAECVIGATLPSLCDTGWLQRKACCFIMYHTQTRLHLFFPLLSGKRFRSIRTKISTLKKLFLIQ